MINDRMREAERAHPGRFIGLAHVPALKPAEAAAELKRCAVELGFPGVVIGSELQDQPLDAEGLRPFWKACADLGLYVFIHPLPRVIRWARMDADDLGRMLGWEFSLMTAAVRLINSRPARRIAELKIQFSHFAGGIGRYLGRIRGFQHRDKWGTAKIPRHGRRPARPFDHYVDRRLYYDIAGWAGPDHAAEWGAHWVRFGIEELAFSQLVFATDYPQAVREPGDVAGLRRGGARARHQRPRHRRRRQCRKAHPQSRARLDGAHLKRRQGARMNDKPVSESEAFDPAANGWEVAGTGFRRLIGPIWRREEATACSALSPRTSIATTRQSCMAAC